MLDARDECLEIRGGICADTRGGVNELTGKLAAEGPGVARSRHPWKLRCDLYEFCDLEVGNKEELT